MAQPPGKRQKLADLSGLKWASDAAVQAILQRLDEQGSLVGHAPSRRTLARAVETRVQEPTIYGSMLQTLPLQVVDGTTWEWHIISPFAMLQWFARHTPAFKECLGNKLSEHPCTPSKPWNIIFYTDEASPGNLLRVDNARRTHAFYYSFHLHHYQN